MIDETNEEGIDMKTLTPRETFFTLIDPAFRFLRGTWEDQDGYFVQHEPTKVMALFDSQMETMLPWGTYPGAEDKELPDAVAYMVSKASPSGRWKPMETKIFPSYTEFVLDLLTRNKGTVIEQWVIEGLNKGNLSSE